MDNPWIQAAATTAQGALGIGIQRLGSRYDRRQQIESQRQMMGLQMQGEKQMMDYQQKLAMDMWNNTNYAAQVEQMKKAGLSPGLMYGKGGPGGATTGPGGSPAVSGGNAPYVDTTGMGMQHGMAMAQQRLMEAQAQNLDADTANKSGVTRENIATQTMDLLQGIENKKAEKAFREIQTDMAGIQKEIMGATTEQAIMKVVAELDSAQAIARSLEIKQFIDEATKNSQVDKLKAEAISILLHNELTRAQTGKVKSDTAVNQQQIKNMAAKIVQDWTGLGIQQQGQDTNAARLELDKQIKNVSDSTKLTVETVKGILQAVLVGKGR